MKATSTSGTPPANKPRVRRLKTARRTLELLRRLNWNYSWDFFDKWKSISIMVGRVGRFHLNSVNRLRTLLVSWKETKVSGWNQSHMMRVAIHIDVIFWNPCGFCCQFPEVVKITFYWALCCFVHFVQHLINSSSSCLHRPSTTFTTLLSHSARRLSPTMTSPSSHWKDKPRGGTGLSIPKLLALLVLGGSRVQAAGRLRVGVVCIVCASSQPSYRF
jgi:hypothetical protein